jgi:hypothetical protein
MATRKCSGLTTKITEMIEKEEEEAIDDSHLDPDYKQTSGSR